MTEITDENLLEMDDEAFEEAQATMDDQVENEDPVEEVADEPTEEVEEPEIDSEETEEAEPEDEVIEPEDDNLADDETLSGSEETESQDEADDSEEVVEEPQGEFNYETSYNQLMKPLKVSGKEVQIKSQDDMRNLAQMGVDYSRKMTDIKPLRVIGETLTSAGLIVDGRLDEAALTRLIDISKGDKNAMAQLMAENNIDPMDVETDDINYVPTARMADEGSIAIQDIERELESRGSVNAVVQELDKLDEKSKQFFNNSPENLLNLDNDIRSGAYEKIMGAVQYEKTLGRLNGMSDMEAYIQLASSNNSTPAEPEAPAPRTTVDKSKKKAASASRRAPVKKQAKQSYDFVNMSDEDFEKHMVVDSLY